jgi:hypothetical protein
MGGVKVELHALLTSAPDGGDNMQRHSEYTVQLQEMSGEFKKKTKSSLRKGLRLYVQTGPAPHLASSPVGTVGCEADHLHLLPSLRTRRVLPPLPHTLYGVIHN